MSSISVIYGVKIPNTYTLPTKYHYIGDWFEYAKLLGFNVENDDYLDEFLETSTCGVPVSGTRYMIRQFYVDNGEKTLDHWYIILKEYAYILPTDKDKFPEQLHAPSPEEIARFQNYLRSRGIDLAYGQYIDMLYHAYDK